MENKTTKIDFYPKAAQEINAKRQQEEIKYTNERQEKLIEELRKQNGDLIEKNHVLQSSIQARIPQSAIQVFLDSDCYYDIIVEYQALSVIAIDLNLIDEYEITDEFFINPYTKQSFLMMMLNHRNGLNSYVIRDAEGNYSSLNTLRFLKENYEALFDVKTFRTDMYIPDDNMMRYIHGVIDGFFGRSINIFTPTDFIEKAGAVPAEFAIKNLKKWAFLRGCRKRGIDILRYALPNENDFVKLCGGGVPLSQEIYELLPDSYDFTSIAADDKIKCGKDLKKYSSENFARDTINDMMTYFSSKMDDDFCLKFSKEYDPIVEFYEEEDEEDDISVSMDEKDWLLFDPDRVGIDDSPALFQKGTYNFIVGEDKAGKTQFVRGLVSASMNGLDFLGLKVPKLNWLYVDSELQSVDMKKRNHLEQEYIDKNPFLSDYYKTHERQKIKPLMLTIDRIRRAGGLYNYVNNQILPIIKKNKIDVVVFDCLYALLDGDQNKSEVAQATQQALRLPTTIGCTVIVIAHTNKAGLNQDKPITQCISGSGDFGKAMSDIIVLSNPNENKVSEFWVGGRNNGKNFSDPEVKHYYAKFSAETSWQFERLSEEEGKKAITVKKTRKDKDIPDGHFGDVNPEKPEDYEEVRKFVKDYLKENGKTSIHKNTFNKQFPDIPYKKGVLLRYGMGFKNNDCTSNGIVINN